MYSPPIKKVDARQRCDFLFRASLCQDTPGACIVQSDGRHTYVGRFVWSAAYAYKMISWYGSCCAGIHLWPTVTCACRSLSRSPLSQSRSDARAKISRYRTLFGWLVWWSCGKSAVHRSTVRSNASSKFLQNYAGRRVRQPRTPNTSAERKFTNLIKLKQYRVKKTVSPSTPTC